MKLIVALLGDLVLACGSAHAQSIANIPYAGSSGTGAPSMSDQIVVHQAVGPSNPGGNAARLPLSALGQFYLPAGVPLTAPGITSTGNASVAGTLGVTGATTVGALTSLGTNAITAGSGGDSIVLTPAATGGAPTITATGTGGLHITAQNSGTIAFSGGALVNIGNGFTYTASGATLTPYFQNQFNVSGNLTGNPTNIYSGASFTINSDTLTLSTANVGFNGFQFTHNLNAGFTGNRHALQTNLVFYGTSGNTLASGTVGYYTTLLGYAIANASDNGTGLTPTTAHGRMVAGNLNSELHSGATNFFGANALELNAQIDTGASALTRTFLNIASVGGAVQGSQIDAGIWFYSSGGALMKTGILFGGGGSGMNQWGIDPAGTIIGSDNSGSVPVQAALGIDFSAVTFSTAFLKSTGFLVDGSGNTTVASLKVGATAGATCTGSPTASFASVGGVVTHC